MRRLPGTIASIMLLIMLGLGGLVAGAAEPAAKVPAPWPSKEAQDKIMGDYDGTFTPAGGTAAKAHGRVIAKGNGQYTVVLYPQSYPQDDPKLRTELAGQVNEKAKSKDKKLTFGGNVNGIEWKGEMKQGKLVASAEGQGGGKFVLKHLVRKSPTAGQKPPKGAAVLLPYDGHSRTSLAAWDNQKWKPLPNGSVEVTHGEMVSKQKFGDCQIHVEFCLPYMPTESGQGRANSGVYVENRYEVQVLDSFGLAALDNDCGGIYTVAAPKVNATFPPLSWQTYDIIFRAARFDANCDTVELPLITVYHNGIKIHEGQDVANPTSGWMPGNAKRDSLRLQDHLNPVRYRNVWVLERNDIPNAWRTELAPLIK